MFRLSKWLCYLNALVLLLLWYGMWRHYVCCGHWHHYLLQLWQAVWASAQTIFFDVHAQTIDFCSIYASDLIVSMKQRIYM
jgi:hypothetical protein